MPVRLILRLTLWATFVTAAVWGVWELSYQDMAPIVSPVEAETSLTLRADGLGEGHFGASRRGGRKHRGIDLVAPLESAVRAAKGGWVAQSKHEPKGMGEYVIISHPKNMTTLYGHLQERFVEVGQRVRQGDVIGSVGKTGNARHRSIKSHVHFELKVDGKTVDAASEEWLEALYEIKQPPRS